MQHNSHAFGTVTGGIILALAAGCGASGGNPSTDGGSRPEGGDARTDTRSSADGRVSADAKPATDGTTPRDGTSTDARPPTDGATPPDGTSTDAGGRVDAPTEAAPTVVSTTPINSATGIAVNAHLGATFSEAMDPASISTTTFSLASGSPAVSVPGTVAYASSTALFWPTANLESNTTFTATITTGAKNAAGISLAASYRWTFATAGTVAAGVPVDLGTASQYVVLAKSAISTVSPSVITGDLGLSPAAATYVTGFSLIADASGVFSTSSQVTGKLYAADYASPTPANLTTAVGDMGTAFTAAAGRAPDVTGLGAGSIGGMTLPAGVYGWGTGLLMATDVTLTGSNTDVWIFQVAKNLTVSNGAHLILAGGAVPANVFWQVSGDVRLGTTVQFDGTILCKTGIALNTGASLTGRLLAQTAVTLDANTLIAPP